MASPQGHVRRAARPPPLEQRADTVACAAQGPGGASSSQERNPDKDPLLLARVRDDGAARSALMCPRENVRGAGAAQVRAGIQGLAEKRRPRPERSGPASQGRRSLRAHAGRCPPEIKLIYATPGMDRVSGTRCSRATHACTRRIYVGCRRASHAQRRRQRRQGCCM